MGRMAACLDANLEVIGFEEWSAGESQSGQSLQGGMCSIFFSQSLEDGRFHCGVHVRNDWVGKTTETSGNGI